MAYNTYKNLSTTDSNKRALLQLNLTSGLGDLFSDVLACISTAEYLRTLNYTVDFIYSLHGNYYPDGPRILEQIFDRSMLSCFNEVTELELPITSKIYNGLTYYNCEHEHAAPGVHHIDVYLSSIPEILKVYNYSASNAAAGDIYPGTLKLTKKIEDKIQSFVDGLPPNYCFLHIRRFSHNNLDVLVNHLKQYINLHCKNIILHAGSDHQELLKELSKEPYIYTYLFQPVDAHIEGPEHIGHCRRINNRQAFNFIDTAVEMFSIKYAKKIFAYSEYTWTSNFLCYGLMHEVPLEKIPYM